MKGVIKWFNKMTGYGIIESDKSNFTFKICSNGQKIESLKEGKIILFEIDHGIGMNSTVNGLYLDKKKDKYVFVLSPLN